MRYLVISILGLFSFSRINGQIFNSYSELGILLGESSYMGDMNPSKPFHMVSPSIGLHLRRSTSLRFSWRTQAGFARIRSADDRSENQYQISRNLSFQSNIFEISQLLEFNFFPFEAGNPKYFATPYIYAGLGAFYFNPKAIFNGQLIELRPLGTEGQGLPDYPDRKNYSRIQLAFPFGIGFRINAGKIFSLGIDWGLRRTFTDYLDDLSKTYVDPDLLIAYHGAYAALLADRSIQNPGRSNIQYQRGNPGTKDWYSIAGLTISMRFVAIKPKCDAYR